MKLKNKSYPNKAFFSSKKAYHVMGWLRTGFFIMHEATREKT